eukprot:5560705-Amphidinium_carterae.1
MLKFTASPNLAALASRTLRTTASSSSATISPRVQDCAPVCSSGDASTSASRNVHDISSSSSSAT